MTSPQLPTTAAHSNGFLRGEYIFGFEVRQGGPWTARNDKGEDQLVLLTQELAALCLAGYSPALNRPIKARRVATFSRILRRQEWTPSLIEFSVNGRICEGVHRCTSVRDTGISAWVYLRFNVPDKERLIRDRVEHRTDSDVLTISGVSMPLKKGQVLAGAVSVMLNIDEGREYPWDYLQDTSHNLINAYANQPLLLSISQELNKKWKMQPNPAAALTALFTLFCMADAKKGRAFIDGIIEGAELKKGDPRLVFREFPHGATVGPYTRAIYMVRLALAWNAFCAGKTNYKMQKPGEIAMIIARNGNRFPVITFLDYAALSAMLRE